MIKNVANFFLESGHFINECESSVVKGHFVNSESSKVEHNKKVKLVLDWMTCISEFTCKKDHHWQDYVSKLKIYFQKITIMLIFCINNKELEITLM